MELPNSRPSWVNTWAVVIIVDVVVVVIVDVVVVFVVLDVDERC